MEYNIKNNTYKQAEKRVKRIKNFYNHLQIFVIIMLPVLLLYNYIIGFFESYIDNGNSLEWVKANIWVNVLLWFIGLTIHGIFAFKYKFNFVDKWEKNKIEEFMNKTD
jgi:uncharacterized membrane protein YGL010W